MIIPWPRKWADRGHPFNPHILQKNIGVITYSSYWSDDCRRDFFSRIVEFLAQHIEIHSNRAYVLSSLPHRHHGVSLPNPWVSALSNAKILMVLMMIDECYNDLGTGLTCGQLLNAFIPVSSDQNCSSRWITVVDSSGYLWFEEYPIEGMITHVLNGHICALIGLYSY
jgi:hypothetical protein